MLPRRAALVALVLFAFSDDLIYYASEFKPYSLDLAFGLAITLMTSAALGRTPSTRVVVWMAILLAAAPWFSFVSAFVVAGCGMVLVLDALLAGRGRTALLWLAMGLGWLANFAIAYQASHALLVPETTMYRFWDFAFLPLGIPPTRDGLLRSAGLLLEVFVNPLNLLAPGGSPLGVVLPLFLLVAGSLSLARRSPPDVPPAGRSDRAGPRRLDLTTLPLPRPAAARTRPGPLPPDRRGHRMGRLAASPARAGSHTGRY